jgi:hypothetical protein
MPDTLALYLDRNENMKLYPEFVAHVLVSALAFPGEVEVWQYKNHKIVQSQTLLLPDGTGNYVSHILSHIAEQTHVHRAIVATESAEVSFWDLEAIHYVADTVPMQVTIITPDTDIGDVFTSPKHACKQLYGNIYFKTEEEIHLRAHVSSHQHLDWLEETHNALEEQLRKFKADIDILRGQQEND